MLRDLLLYSVFVVFLFSCEEDKKPPSHLIRKATKSAVNTTKKEAHLTSFNRSVKHKAEVILPRPRLPYDPIDPCPIDPPGYIPEPINLELPPSPPKTLRDSIVNFPATMASFGTTATDIFKTIDDNIVGSMEWSYLRELGIEGKIYVRLLIDVNGKVRDVTFLKFSDKELEILKGKLNKALFAMPNWSPAKNEQGQAVVSEYTFPIRVSFQK